VLFLSYAEEDKETASEIARWLNDNGFNVFRWEDPSRRGGQFIRQIENAIRRSDAFLVLLSPSFLASDWCRREREVAIRREQDLQVSDPDRGFIHVLQIVATPHSDAGFLGGYDWLDLTSPRTREAPLGELAGRLGPEDEPAAAGPREVASRPGNVPRAGSSQPMSADPAAPKFRNREDELEKVLRGLTVASGPHFWLVIAPPQLGKTWFLRRVSADPALSGSIPWVTRLVDLRAEPADVHNDDPGALLASLFGLTSPVTIGQEALRGIAREIIRSGRPHLCLLDSAELLSKGTAATVRSCLSQIHRLVQNAGKKGVRLALIVASRREDEWRGVTPDPRLSPLSLTEFKAGVVQQALRDLAREMDQTFSDAEYRQNAMLAHRLTEGLPALLVRCLQWIQAEQWLGMDALESQELFEELTDPYVLEELLAWDSLFPGGQVQGDELLQALVQAFRVLAPYRLFTMSHLRHHLESDPAFSAAMQGQQWDLEHLWKAISGTALLLRPLNEPWQEIYAAIRRLLHRHYYKSAEQQAEAHCEARKFVEVWADQQSGKEQVIGMVESLWHEATVLRIRNPAEMEQSLSESARTLSRALRSSTAYTVDELREYASERMRNDEELEETVSNVDGLFTRLVEIVASPL
jgi:hypothetical protein